MKAFLVLSTKTNTNDNYLHKIYDSHYRYVYIRNSLPPIKIPQIKEIITGDTFLYIHLYIQLLFSIQ